MSIAALTVFLLYAAVGLGLVYVAAYIAVYAGRRAWRSAERRERAATPLKASSLKSAP